MSRLRLSGCMLAVLVACGAPSGDATLDDGPDASFVDATPREVTGTSAHAIGCSPTPPGQPGIVWIPGPLRAMEHDPVRCLLYAVTSAGPDSQLVVIDTAAKREVARVDLGHPARDISVAGDGSRIGIAHGDGVNEITLITPPSWDTLVRVPTTSDVDSLVVTRDSRAYYYSRASIYEVVFATGFSERRRSAIASPTAQLVLSSDETSLWVGSVGATPGSLKRLAIAADGTMTIADRSEHLLLADLGSGGDIALSADGTRVGYAGFIFDTADLSIVHGGMSASIQALDANGRFGLHDRGAFDAALVRTVSVSPIYASDSVLTPNDDEAWRYDPLTDLMHVGNIADLVDATDLGQREWAPLPMAAYHFDHLLVDPTRPWLYALDVDRGELVILDRATLAPMQAILVGIAATGLALDPSGDQLLVGHHYTWGIARIDLATLTFDGYLWTHNFADQVVALRPGRVAVLGGYTSRDIRLMDLVSGSTLDVSNDIYREATATASPNGMQLRVGERGSSASCLTVLDTQGDQLVVLRELDFSSCPQVFYPTQVTAVPATTDVFWARGRWDTATLTRTFALTALIHTVTSDGRLAFSADQVFDAATGALLGALPDTSAAQALSPDETTLYLGVDGAIEVVDLSTYMP